MKHSKTIFLLSVFSINLLALSILDATKALNASVQPSTDIWTVDDYLFIKVEAQISEEDTEEERDEKIMLSLMDKLYSYVCSEANEKRYASTPFSLKLSKFILGEINLTMNNIGNCTVKQTESKISRVQIIAFEKKDIESLKEKVSLEVKNIKERSDAEWNKLLAEKFKSLKTAEERQTFLLMLGTPLANYLRTRIIQYNKPFDDISEKGWNEFVSMIEWPIGTYYSSAESSLWKIVWSAKGNVSFPQSKIPLDSQFKEAKQLYGQGKDIDRILALLKTSIESSPDSIDKWRYLGGALKVKKMYREAFISYLEALRFEPDNLKILEDITALCSLCDMPVNANGMKWYLGILKELKKK